MLARDLPGPVTLWLVLTSKLVLASSQGPPGPRDLQEVSAGQGPPGPLDLLASEASAGQGTPGPRGLLSNFVQGFPGPVLARDLTS